MLANPRIGQRVRLRYGRHWQQVPHIATRLHDCVGVVVIRGKGKPRNHGVKVNGVVYIVPCGHLMREESDNGRESP